MSSWQDQETPLHRAADNGHEEVVEVLLAKGASVNAVDKVGTGGREGGRERGMESESVSESEKDGERGNEGMGKLRERTGRPRRRRERMGEG